MESYISMANAYFLGLRTQCVPSSRHPIQNHPAGFYLLGDAHVCADSNTDQIHSVTENISKFIQKNTIILVHAGLSRWRQN